MDISHAFVQEGNDNVYSEGQDLFRRVWNDKMGSISIQVEI